MQTSLSLQLLLQLCDNCVTSTRSGSFEGPPPPKRTHHPSPPPGPPPFPGVSRSIDILLLSLNLSLSLSSVPSTDGADTAQLSLPLALVLAEARRNQACSAQHRLIVGPYQPPPQLQPREGTESWLSPRPNSRLPRAPSPICHIVHRAHQSSRHSRLEGQLY